MIGQLDYRRVAYDAPPTATIFAPLGSPATYLTPSGQALGGVKMLAGSDAEQLAADAAQRTRVGPALQAGQDAPYAIKDRRAIYLTEDDQAFRGGGLGAVSQADLGGRFGTIALIVLGWLALGGPKHLRKAFR